MLPCVRALVTGGAGFIGSHLTDRLIADGHQITVVDDLSHGPESNLADALSTGQCSLVQHDVTAAGTAELVAVSAPDVVFHLAAQIDVRSSVADPAYDASVNVLGTVRVLEAARLAGARKVVFASSVAVYGPNAPLPVREDSPVSPLSPYAVSKFAGEQYLFQYGRLHGLAGTALVFGNVYGPRQDPHGEAGVIAIFTDSLLAGRPTMVFGDGGNTRDYLFVGDVVEALMLAGVHGRGDGGRFNIGTGVATSDLDLHATVAAAAGEPHSPSFAPARPGDLRAMVLDCTAAERELGWTARTSLATGVAHTVDWARSRASAAAR
jgi:UDP-glucose 4-epimerase